MNPKVIILYNSPSNAQDLSETSVFDVANDILKALIEYQIDVKLVSINSENLFEVIQDIISKRDKIVVFNLCEALDGKVKYEFFVSGLLELYKIPFTGNTSSTILYSLNKAVAKAILSKAKIPVTKSWVYSEVPNYKLIKSLSYPLFVKPIGQDGSLGISEMSYVISNDELIERIRFIINQFGEPALVEPYLSGREFNVGVTCFDGNINALPVSEIVFGGVFDKKPAVLTYHSKWTQGHADDIGSVPHCPANINDKTKKLLQKIAINAFKTMGCRSYARFDFRLDKKEDPYLIEVNPNPDLSYNAAMGRAIRASGKTYQEFIYLIVREAWKDIL